VVDRVAREIRQTLARVDIGIDKVLGVGVVAPGPFSRHAGLTYAVPVMAQWSDFPLAAALERAIGLSVVLDNDATAAALGEYWAGGVDVGTAFAALYMGTGLGAGIVVDGTVLRGASSNAGELGHICLQPDGPLCWCGARGCVEALAGPARVVQRAAEVGLELPGSSVAQAFAEIARMAARGDEVAVGLLQDSARYLAVAAQTLANLLDLELLVLTGPGFAMAGSQYLPVMQEHLDATFFARQAHSARVLISSNAPYAAAIGATALVLQSELSPRQAGSRVSVESQALAAAE
jgi:predicted NBD/HSP70 family sugar kinase